MLEDEQIIKFQQLSRAHFAEEMSSADAMEKGLQLVRLMRLVYKPITYADLSRVLQRRKNIGIDKEENEQ